VPDSRFCVVLAFFQLWFILWFLGNKTIAWDRKQWKV
jgi:hypothetical protein